MFHRSTKVVRIVEKDGRAGGVEIEGGEVLEADIVVVGVGREAHIIISIFAFVFAKHFPNLLAAAPLFSPPVFPPKTTLIQYSHIHPSHPQPLIITDRLHTAPFIIINDMY